MNFEFSLKDLGTFGYFLGMEVTHIDEGLHLCLSKYAKDLLDKVHVSTSMSTGKIIFKIDGVELAYATQYRLVIEAL